MMALGPAIIQPRRGFAHAMFWVTPAEASILEGFSFKSSENLVFRRAGEDSKMELREASSHLSTPHLD